MKHINKFQKTISILLLFSYLFIFSCSNDIIITNSANETDLQKQSGFGGINSGDDDNISPWDDVIDRLSDDRLHELIAGFLLLVYVTDIDVPGRDNILCLINRFSSDRNSNIAYDFRDNYLSHSDKGKIYTVLYYYLSYYSIENNIVMKYPLEHLAIIETGIEVSKELQNGINTNNILINKSTYDALKSISKIYRQSENHQDIEPVLDYLETDLEKYYNKPQAEIAVDFGF